MATGATPGAVAAAVTVVGVSVATVHLVMFAVRPWPRQLLVLLGNSAPQSTGKVQR